MFFFFLQSLDGRTSWGTLISAFRILVESNDDRLYIVYNNGLQIVFEVSDQLVVQCIYLIDTFCIVIPEFARDASRSDCLPCIGGSDRNIVHNAGFNQVSEELSRFERCSWYPFGQQGLVGSIEKTGVSTEHVQSAGNEDTLYR